MCIIYIYYKCFFNTVEEHSFQKTCMWICVMESSTLSHAHAHGRRCSKESYQYETSRIICASPHQQHEKKHWKSCGFPIFSCSLSQCRTQQSISHEVSTDKKKQTAIKTPRYESSLAAVNRQRRFCRQCQANSGYGGIALVFGSRVPASLGFGAAADGNPMEPHDSSRCS